jgi:hypothetical protein
VLPPPHAPWSHRLVASAGRPVVEHLAPTGSPESSALAHFADRLETCRGIEGFAQLLGRSSDGGHLHVSSSLPGARSLDRIVADDLERELATLATLAVATARLHERGAFVGGFTANDVLLGGDGRPTIARLGPEVGEDEDVGALLALLHRRVADHDLPPALRALEARSTPPTAAAVGRALAHALPVHPDPLDAPPPHGPRRRPGVAHVAVALLGISAVVGGGVLLDRGGAAVESTEATPAAPGSPAVDPPTCAAYRPVGELAAAPCPTVPSDGIVTIDGRRYAVSAAGAGWQLGDWTCDGDETLVLLLPDGTAARYDSWPGAGNEATPITVSVGTDASLLVPEPGTCGPPAMVTADGTSMPIEAP